MVRYLVLHVVELCPEALLASGQTWIRGTIEKLAKEKYAFLSQDSHIYHNLPARWLRVAQGGSEPPA